jgi:hypothetical protein
VAYLSGDQAAAGKATLADIQARVVKPMQVAFRRDDREVGLQVFMGLVMREQEERAVSASIHAAPAVICNLPLSLVLELMKQRGGFILLPSPSASPRPDRDDASETRIT